jgi:O-acetylhomoserine/O-acetylserine sulfhydrylase-like pyridoxal-dependent enzyme
MALKKDKHFNTRFNHTGQNPKNWEGSTQPPIFQTASHSHPTAENLSQIFVGKTTDFVMTLGRPWKPFSIVVIQYETTIDTAVNFPCTRKV